METMRSVPFRWFGLALVYALSAAAMYSQYSARQLRGHYASYPAIPAVNVQYIIKGYDVAKAGVLCYKSH